MWRAWRWFDSAWAVGNEIGDDGAIALAAVWTPAAEQRVPTPKYSAGPIGFGSVKESRIATVCCLLLAFMVPFALGVGWIGGDDASGALSGSNEVVSDGRTQGGTGGHRCIVVRCIFVSYFHKIHEIALV